MTDSSINAFASGSQLLGPGIPGSSTQTSATPAPLSEQTVAKKCLDIVELFRRARVSKASAHVSLTHLIGSETDDATPEDIAIIATPYFDMLDQWQEEQDRAAGASGAAIVRDQPEPSEAGDRQGVPAREAGHESDSDGEGERPARKRTKLDMSCLEQASKLHGTGPTLSANLRRTNAVLLNWSQEPKEARRQLMYHELSPEFHESGWMEIVTGKCVNLDNVFSIIASSRTIDKHTETIGGIELRYGTSEAVSKRISTQSAWIVAWNRTARALLFAFPH
jgi:hypothetical protein